MAKKRNSRQENLFRTEIPKMPEGYYSPGPNPYLHRFTEQYAKPYFENRDKYKTPAFNKTITTKKTTKIYNMHTYWSKKPHEAIRQYIRHYTKPGDIVLDPMCGSGGTALAALMEGRAPIAIDLSPAATFITKNYCTLIDLNGFQRAFELLKTEVLAEMNWLYETRCDRCDGRATTAYTVYSYIFRCSRCLNKVPLFDCVEAEGMTASGNPKKITACPFCLADGYIEEINTRGERFDPIPVLVSYFCDEGCKPQRDQRQYNDSDPKKREFFERYDLGKLNEIERKDIPHWYPPHRMMNVESDTDPWGDKWRAGTSSFRTVAELYSKRNLWALAALREAAQHSKYKDTFMFCLSAISLSMSRMYLWGWKDEHGIIKGTYYIPQLYRSQNASDAFDAKVGAVYDAIEIVNSTVKDPIINISTQSATNISEIPDNSIDYVFTDPPYGGNVQYGELNFIWEAWLNLDTNWQNQEIIVNNTRGMDEYQWAQMMSSGMAECLRVLKPGRWLSLCYHDTSEGTWQLIQDLMTEVGFVPEVSDNTLYIDTGQKSYNQYVADKVTRRDLVINFRKPRPGELSYPLTLFGDEEQSTFTQKARAIIAESLEKHPGSSADRLYDELVSRMVRKGEFERHNFDEILHSVAEGVDGRWYLLETADQVDEAENHKEADAAAHLETFMHQYLHENPGEIGVHYSDLFERYLLIQAKPRRLMQEWLPEFFFKTESATGVGTWRPPANEEERAQKEALRISGTLRRIKRFANALLEGVPPHERDIPANTATAADWIRQCRRAGLYGQGRALYEKGGFTFDGLGEEARMEVEEDYQICVRRSS